MKMKLLYITISFTLVNVSVAVSDTEIEPERTPLQTPEIENEDIPDTPITPDSPFIPDIPDEPEIQNENKFIKEAIKTNLHMADQRDRLPEVIKKCISEKINMEALDLMLSEPDRPIHTLTLMRGYIPYPNRMVGFEKDMQRVIKEVTETDTPKIDNEADYENVSLTHLGKERRKLTLEAVKKLILSALDGKDEDFDESFRGFRALCDAIGVFWTIKQPARYVFSAEVVQKRHPDSGAVVKVTCIIKSVNSPELGYEYLSGKVWQLQFENQGPPYYLLSSQVQDFL